MAVTYKRLQKLVDHLASVDGKQDQIPRPLSQKEPRKHTYLGLGAKGFHRLAYTEWGDEKNPRVLLCVHGLTRNGRDFDYVAQALCDKYRVICPDIVGRGQSEWLADKTGYTYPQYLADITALIARLNVSELHWLGTSMGGILGMLMASLPGTPIRRLLLNDIGAVVSKDVLEYIRGYVSKNPQFKSYEEAGKYIRTIAVNFGTLTDKEWEVLISHSIKQQEDKTWCLRYDPAIGDAFKGELNDVNFWPIYDQIRCPTMILRGVTSTALTHPIAQEMTKRGPKAQYIEIEGCGHAPSLLPSSQIEIVRKFFLDL